MNGPRKLNIAWKLDLPCYYSSPVVAADGTIYLVGKDGEIKWTVELMKLTPDGAVAWSTFVNQTGVSAPAVDGHGTAYVTDSSLLFAFDSSGAQLWSFDSPNGAPMDQAGIAIGPDGTVFAEAGNTIHAVLGGAYKWAFTTSWAFIESSPIVDPEGYVYAVSADNNVYCIAPDGAVAWSYLAPDAFRSSPAMGADGTVYVASQDSMLYAFIP